MTLKLPQEDKKQIGNIMLATEKLLKKGSHHQQADRRKWGSALSEAIRDFCKRTNASGEMIHLLVEGICWELQDSPLVNMTQHSESSQALIADQELVGWFKFFQADSQSSGVTSIESISKPTSVPSRGQTLALVGFLD